jgi:hypothetical protein
MYSLISGGIRQYDFVSTAAERALYVPCRSFVRIGDNSCSAEHYQFPTSCLCDLLFLSPPDRTLTKKLMQKGFLSSNENAGSNNIMTKNDIKNQLLVQADETSGMDGNVRRKIFSGKRNS